jgi:hypothetical protein
MSDVLSRVEYAEGETGEEITRRQEASDRAQSETGAVFKEIRDVFELGNVVCAVSAVLDEQREDVVVLTTGY